MTSDCDGSEEEMEIGNANDQNIQLSQVEIEAHNELPAADLADYEAHEVHMSKYLLNCVNLLMHIIC